MSAMKLIKRPDHDPNHPYHYHDANGNKIVITPEEWEANVGKPYFKEIEDAVRAEQAAYPGPEYEVNPDFVRDLRRTYSYNMGSGYQNYRNFSSSLPQGYSFTDEGMIVDPQGNYYVQSGYRQTPRFTYSTDNPLQFTIHKGKPIERNLTFYPVNMDKRVKAPLPVDRVMDVGNEYENSINNYIENNVRYKFNTFDDDKGWWRLNIPEYVVRRIANANGDVVHSVINLSKKEYDDYLKEAEDFGENNFVTFLRNLKPIKPSHQEAQKKAVISIGPLERIKSNKIGGKLIRK